MNERTFFKQECFTHFPGVRWGTRKYESDICATEGLKIGGLRSGPLLEMRGFQNWSSFHEGV